MLDSKQNVGKIKRAKLHSWLSIHDVIRNEQHGSISATSAETLLSDSLHDWLTTINDGKWVEVVFFDLSKACDLTSRKFLLTSIK